MMGRVLALLVPLLVGRPSPTGEACADCVCAHVRRRLLPPPPPSPPPRTCMAGGQAQPCGPGGQRARSRDRRHRQAAGGEQEDQPEPVGAGQRDCGADRPQRTRVPPPCALPVRPRRQAKVPAGCMLKLPEDAHCTHAWRLHCTLPAPLLSAAHHATLSLARTASAHLLAASEYAGPCCALQRLQADAHPGGQPGRELQDHFHGHGVACGGGVCRCGADPGQAVVSQLRQPAGCSAGGWAGSCRTAAGPARPF